MRRLFAAGVCWLALLCASQAQIMGVTSPGSGLGRFTPTASPPVQTSTTTATFASVPIGPAAANRVVAVSALLQLGGVSTVTVGGVSATKQVQQNAIGADISIWTATVPSGTTANVVVVASGSATQSIHVGYFYGSPTAFATTGTNSGGLAIRLTTTLNMPGGRGFGLVVSSLNQNVATAKDCAWTNTTAIRGDLTSLTASPAAFSTAEVVVNQSSITVGCVSPVTAQMQIIGASWQ